MIQNWQIPLLMTVLAGLATIIGGFITFLVNKNNLKILSLGLGFSAGVMIFVSFTEILSTAEGLLKEYYPVDYHWIMFGGFIAGVIISKLIDTFVPDHVEGSLTDGCDNSSRTHKIKRAGLLTAIAIAIHNFPEGCATFISSLDNLTLGVAIAIAVAIHNIPEGLAVSLPIYHATGDKKKAFIYSALSGFAEPLGAFVGALILLPFIGDLTLAISFAVIAGIMVFISLDELLPAAKTYDKAHDSLYGLIAGMAIMALSLNLLGQ